MHHEPDSHEHADHTSDPVTAEHPGDTAGEHVAHGEESHPVTTGVGALSVGVGAMVAGATFGGPVGAALGAVVGAAVGGKLGHEMGEATEDQDEDHDALPPSGAAPA